MHFGRLDLEFERIFKQITHLGIFWNIMLKIPIIPIVPMKLNTFFMKTKSLLVALKELFIGFILRVGGGYCYRHVYN